MNNNKINYIAFLRGINVGGKNIIKMTALKDLFLKCGMLNVQTFIQSGNVLFESELQEDEIKEKLETTIELEFGFHVPIVLRTIKELHNILNTCPFSQTDLMKAESTAEGESLYVFLCAEKLQEKHQEKLTSIASSGDLFHVDGRNIYVLFYHSIRNSKLAAYLQRLDIPCTSRNWKTLCRILNITT